MSITHNPYHCPLCRMRWATAPEHLTSTADPRHAACHAWDDRGYSCGTDHDCDAATIVSRPLPLTGNRWVITGGPTPQTFTPGLSGRGAHRAA